MSDCLQPAECAEMFGDLGARMKTAERDIAELKMMMNADLKAIIVKLDHTNAQIQSMREERAEFHGMIKASKAMIGVVAGAISLLVSLAVPILKKVLG